MNPELNIVHHENRVCAENENIYSEFFFDKIDGVATALDNVDARMFIDRKCVVYHKPLIDSGTLGTMGNIQCIIPHVTESYASSTDPPEKSIPVCTLRHFPNAIEHTIQWARDKFEGFFTNYIADAEKFINDDDYLLDLQSKCNRSSLESLQSIKKALIDERPENFLNCVEWARCQFQELYANQIQQLLYNFPPDQAMPNGQYFWTGAKKMPLPIMFDVNQQLHVDFIMSAANLRAEMYGIEQCRDYSHVFECLRKIHVPIFEPKSGVKIPVNDSELEEGKSDDEEKIDEIFFAQLIEELKCVKKDSLRNIRALCFEKDNEDNLHMDFVTATSNLRATNYKIPTADKFKTKLIAGKIIPAIAR